MWNRHDKWDKWDKWTNGSAVDDGGIADVPDVREGDVDYREGDLDVREGGE